MNKDKPKQEVISRKVIDLANAITKAQQSKSQLLIGQARRHSLTAAYGLSQGNQILPATKPSDN
jgi:hypothetical protein